MAICLAKLINLERLGIDIQSTGSRPDPTSPPLLPHAVLPAPTCLHLKGVGAYLEDLLSRIDAPILQTLSIVFKDAHTHILQLPIHRSR